MAIKGRFDLDTEFGTSAYRNTKGRTVPGLSIGLHEPQLHQDRRRHELTDRESIAVVSSLAAPMTVRAVEFRRSARVSAPACVPL